jgi:hypothetical protein
MISVQHECIFIHVPKCGGTSIEAALGHYVVGGGRGQQDHRTYRDLRPGLVWTGLFGDEENRAEYRRRFHRKPLLHEKNAVRVTRRAFRKCFKFTIVRNPWDRAYSWYRNYARDHHHSGDRLVPPFGEFLATYVGKGNLRPQLYWIADYDGVIRLDHVGRFERLEEEFEVIARRLGLTTPLPHLLAGDTGDYRGAYTQEARNLIARTYEREIDLFGYEF